MNQRLHVSLREICPPVRHLLPHTWQRRGQQTLLASGAEEDVQRLLIRDVHQLHLVQQVHVHLHGRDAADCSCGGEE